MQPSLNLFEEPSEETSSGPPPNEDGWLGFVLGHRQLLQALEQDYLLLDPPSGVRIGACCYAINHEEFPPEHNIQVFIKVDLGSLPSVNLSSTSNSEGPQVSLATGLENGTIIAWHCVLPVSAFREIAVETEEQQVRLAGFSRLADNIRFPVKPSAQVGLASLLSTATPSLECRASLGTDLQRIDSYRGAACMALSGIPRMEPWITSLFQSLSRHGLDDQHAVPSIPSWMRQLPWDSMGQQAERNVNDVDALLWNSIVRELIQAHANDAFDPRAFLRSCMNPLSDHAQSEDAKQTLEYLSARTELMLSGRESIRVKDEHLPVVGLALQLFLLRLKPDQYRTWSTDHPDLSLPAWVAGLIFCGLLNGYRSLPIDYRNIAPEGSQPNSLGFNTLLLLHFLSGSQSEPMASGWPHCPTRQPQVCVDGSALRMTWDGINIGVKHASERMAWYVADLVDPQISNTAMLVARKLGWPCISTSLTLPPGSYPINGTARIAPDLPAAGVQLIVEDQNLRIEVPSQTGVSESLDVQLFRHHLIAASGDFRQADIKELTPVMTCRTPDQTPDPHPRSRLPEKFDIPGLSLYRDYISVEEERDLLLHIKRGEWKPVSNKSNSRQVQHFGWRYDYKSRGIQSSDYLGPLPQWAKLLAQRLHQEGLMPYVADQLIINKYQAGQGIAAHIDCPTCFMGYIVSISLLESWTMWFTSEHDKDDKRSVLLHSRSALVLSGESRNSWSHSIRNRKTDESKSVRERRISLTFRKVIAPSS